MFKSGVEPNSEECYLIDAEEGKFLCEFTDGDDRAGEVVVEIDEQSGKPKPTGHSFEGFTSDEIDQLKGRAVSQVKKEQRKRSGALSGHRER